MLEEEEEEKKHGKIKPRCKNSFNFREAEKKKNKQAGEKYSSSCTALLAYSIIAFPLALLTH